MPEAILMEGLSGRAARLLDGLAERATVSPAGATLVAALDDERDRLAAPMRVAIVGLIKAGKSTLMNAILGAEVVPTGFDETTFNVNVLTWGERPALFVHREPGAPPEPIEFSALARLTARTAIPKHARDIRFVEVRYPSEVLKRINLIDTPGLGSSYGIDSAKTETLLRVAGEVTRREAADADAILYLFSRGLADHDQSVLEQFQGDALGRATPLNSLGVLTQADAYWPAQEAPFQSGRRIADRLMALSRVRQALFQILPVSGLLAFGCRTLEQDAIDDLATIARLPPELFERAISNARWFTQREIEGIAVPPVRRAVLWQKLGQFGIVRFRALLLDEGIAPNEARLKLLEESGIPHLEQVIVRHFGNRALVLKLQATLHRLGVHAFALRRRADPDARALADVLIERLEAFKAGEEVFALAELLRDACALDLDFSEDEVAEIRALAGEHGEAPWARLRAADGTPASELLALARTRASSWRGRANELSLLAAREEHAARIVCRSLEKLCASLE